LETSVHLTSSASPQAPTGGVAGWATDLVDTLGGPGAGLAIALENLFPPLPSEVILPLTGFAAAQGVLSLVSALFWTTLGSTVGAMALYGIGRAFGRDRMHAIWAKLPLVKSSDLERTEAWFARHGSAVRADPVALQAVEDPLLVGLAVESPGRRRVADAEGLRQRVHHLRLVVAGGRSGYGSGGRVGPLRPGGGQRRDRQHGGEQSVAREGHRCSFAEGDGRL
jgi:hypothetical protein